MPDGFELAEIEIMRKRIIGRGPDRGGALHLVRHVGEYKPPRRLRDDGAVRQLDATRGIDDATALAGHSAGYVNFLTRSNGSAKTRLHARRNRAEVAEPEGVGHGFIEESRKNSTVNNPGPALMMFGWDKGPGGSAGLVARERDVKSNGILGAAGEAGGGLLEVRQDSESAGFISASRFDKEPIWSVMGRQTCGVVALFT